VTCAERTGRFAGSGTDQVNITALHLRRGFTAAAGQRKWEPAVIGISPGVHPPEK
jgi:hypothetical protein